MNFVAENIGSGISIYVFACYCILYLAFKRIGSVISIGDPISLYLFFRFTPALIVLIMCIFYMWDTHTKLISLYAFSLLISCIPIIIIGYRKLQILELDCKEIYSFALFLCFFKLALILPTISSYPIFTGGGSDAIIQYYESNKIAGTFTLGIGNIDLILLSFLRRSELKWNKRNIVKLFMIIFVLLSLITLKKGAVLNMIFAIVFGEALASRFIKNPRPPIFSLLKIFFAFSIAIGWAYYIALESGVKFKSLDILFLFDLAIYQYMVPYITYFKQDFWLFSTTYEFDKFLFYFHTITKPLGAPAFEASIGPSYHDYLYGSVTGNGINPTFLLEGLVFWGSYGILTTLLYTLVSLGFIIILYLRFRPPMIIILTVIVVTLIPILWIDSLLFMKRFFSILIVLIIYTLYVFLTKPLKLQLK